MKLLSRLRNRFALGVQNWMALDLWMALGLDSEDAPKCPFDAWPEMLSTIRQSGHGKAFEGAQQRLLDRLDDDARLWKSAFEEGRRSVTQVEPETARLNGPIAYEPPEAGEDDQ